MTVTEHSDVAYDHALPHYRHRLDVAVAYLASRAVPFTADDVRREVPDQPAGAENVLPSVMARAAKTGRIVRVSDQATQRRSRHSARIGVWIGGAA